MKDPLVEAGLRALREEAPSDESRRATLARLGLAEAPTALGLPQTPTPHAAPAAPSPAAPSPAANGALRWLLIGVVLGVIALVSRHWFG